MIEVYVWDFRGVNVAWGHAAMQVNHKAYVSWWPDRSSGAYPELPKATAAAPNGKARFLLSQVYFAPPFRGRTFEEDKRAEGSESGSGGAKPPDHTIAIHGLNETAILDWWASFGLQRHGSDAPLQGPLQAWSTLSLNCSTVVALGLTVGGGARYAPLWARNKVWIPQAVQKYAQAVREGIQKQVFGPRG